MSDLHFLKELGAEFTRLGDGQRSGLRRADRGWVPRGAVASLGLALSVLVVIAVFIISIGVHGPARPGSSGSDQRRITVAFSATTIYPRAALGPAITRAIAILRSRLVAVPGVRVSRTANGVAVTAPGGQAARARITALALAAPAQLSFYDWEADVLTPAGKPLIKQLMAHDPAAITISQGVGTAQPGEADAGGLTLYSAVRLAARQPAVAETSGLGRPGRQYYLFGAPGSAACATATRDQHTARAPDQPCMLLAGPVTETSTNSDQIDRDVSTALLPGISASQGRLLAVPQGTVVLQAARAAFAARPSTSTPSAYFVLRDRVALAGRNIIDPHQSTDQSGSPDVQFGFTPAGANAFQLVTAQITHRGQLISAFHQSMNQHFAVAYNGRLITVPQIDFRTYPDGIQGNQGADITGGFTVSSAQALAASLRLGPLPVRLAVR
ncbi:MAG: hypothetical protein ABI355_13665 [Solirubrobacteraceae bacterium]